MKGIHHLLLPSLILVAFILHQVEKYQLHLAFQEVPVPIHSIQYLRQPQLLRQAANNPHQILSIPDKPILKIPPLSLPTKTSSLNTATSYTWSSRRMNHDLDYINSESLKLSIDTLWTQTSTSTPLNQDKDNNKLFQCQTAQEYFASLSAKLGELYIVNDLTYLIPIKRDLDLQFLANTKSDNFNSSTLDSNGSYEVKDPEYTSVKDEAHKRRAITLPIPQ